MKNKSMDKITVLTVFNGLFTEWTQFHKIAVCIHCYVRIAKENKISKAVLEMAVKIEF